MSHQTTAWRTRPAPPPQVTYSCPTWLQRRLLVLPIVILIALASAAAWLSYHAQVAYVLDHNGGHLMQAKVWALLLDTGAAGLSILRLYEALMRHSGAATRTSLIGCITGSATMNLLHTPSCTVGGYLVAAVPPIMYAIFLEHLLAKLRSALIREEKQRSVWRTAALWMNFPGQMWRGWRSALRTDAERSAALLLERSTKPVPLVPTHRTSDTCCVKQPALTASRRRGRGPGQKRIAFEAALKDQVQSGDLRLFSADERIRNAAAYQAAASLPAPLAKGTARRYVAQALTRFDKVQMSHRSGAVDAHSPTHTAVASTTCADTTNL